MDEAQYSDHSDVRPSRSNPFSGCGMGNDLKKDRKFAGDRAEDGGRKKFVLKLHNSLLSLFVLSRLVFHLTLI